MSSRREVLIRIQRNWKTLLETKKRTLICLKRHYCWFSQDGTKIQTTKLSILLKFYFHDVLEQLKANFRTNFRFKRILGFVIGYASISNLLRDVASA